MLGPKSSVPPKNLLGLPWRVAFALQDAGWILRSDIVWAKPNPMPESVRDRPTRSKEYVFLLAKNERYYYDAEAVRTAFKESSVKRMDYMPKAEQQSGGANLRDVWNIYAQPYRDAHFATFPEELVQRCVLAGCPEGGTVLDPFHGSGTVGLVARKLDRHFIGVELNPEYVAMADARIANDGIAGTRPLFSPAACSVDSP